MTPPGSTPLQISVVLDPASTARLVADIGAAFQKGFAVASKGIEAEMARIGKSFAKSINLATTAAGNATTGLKNMGKAGTTAFTPAEKHVKAFTDSLIKSLHPIGVIISELARLSTQERRRSVERTNASDNTARLEIANVRNVGIQTNIEGQRAVVTARGAAKSRVLITQGMVRSIILLEKGLGATISGIARTSVSAFSKAFSGIGGILRRDTRNIDSEMRRTTQAVARGVRATNQEFNSGLSSSLNRRESTMRQSFTQQEQIVRRSIVRQQATIAALRTATSTGVTGAVTGRGIGGGLLAPLAGVAGASALLTSGFQRFSDLERINKQFLALTGNITDTNNLMAEVKQFAKETPFDLVGVADLAKGFLAIKTPIDQVLPRVRAIADAVALTGGGVQQLDRIQRAIGQVVSTGKLQGDELNQLAENLPGLNIRQILADQLTGGNVATLVELQEAGDISGQQFVDGLITGLQNDKRLVGASEDLAKTLGGRVANLKESFADFGASLIGTIAAPLKIVILTVQTGLQSLADFVKGENLSAPLEVLRDALKGVALGLLAIVAAKGAIETVKLLGTVAQLALNPFGALLLAAGLIGGAIAVLAKRSEPFRDAITGIIDKVKALGSIVGGQVVRGLNALAGVIERNVLPLVFTLATWVGDHLVDAFHSTVRFIEDKAIPALKTAGIFIGRVASVGFRAVVSFVRDHVIPTLASFIGFVVAHVIPTAIQVGTVLVGAFGTALDAVQRFWTWVEPVLRPMLEGFKELGGAIAAIFTGGDFSQLGSGFAAVGSGIASSFAGIGRNLLDVLDGLWETLSSFFKRVFSGPNLIALGKGFLDLVEWIGNTLGSIVTNPKFIAGVAALAAGIAAAAVLVAGRFLEGFARAFLDNGDRWWGIIGNAILAGIVGAIKNPEIVLGIALALALVIGAALRARGLVQSFRKAGEEAGGGFTGGLRGALRKASFGAQSGLLQFRAIFDGNAFAKYAKEQAFKAGTAFVKEFGRANALLRTANLPGLQPINPGFMITRKQSTEAIANLEQVRAKLGPVGFAALEARTNLQSMFAVLRTAKTEIGGISTAFIDNFASGQGFFKSMKNAFTGAMQAIKRTALTEGLVVGSLIRQGIGAALNAAAFAAGGFVGGKAEGSAGGSGLTTAILGGLTAAAITGSPIIGALTAATALLGAAFGRAGKKAKEFREEIERLSRSLGDNLVKAIEDGVLRLNAVDLKNKIDIGDIISLPENVDEEIAAFAKGLTTEQINFIIDADVGGFEGVVKLLADVDGDIEKFSTDWQKRFVDNTAASEKFAKKFGVDVPKVRDLINTILKPNDNIDDVHDFLLGLSPNQLANDPFIQLVRNNEAYIDSLLKTSGQVRETALQIGEAAEFADAFARATAKIPPIDIKINHGERGGLAKTHEELVNIGLDLVRIDAQKHFETLNTQSFVMFQNFLKAGQSVEEAQKSLEKFRLPPVSQTVIDAWEDELDHIAERAGNVQEILDSLPAALAVALGGGGEVAVTAAEAEVQAKFDADQIQAAIAESGLEGPELVVALKTSTLDIGKFITDAIANETIVDEVSAAAALAPLRDAMINSLDPEAPGFAEAKQRILDIFTGSDISAQVRLGLAADAEADLVANIQRIVTENPMTTEVTARFLIELDTDQGFLTEGDMKKFGVPKGQSLLAKLTPTKGEVDAAFAPVGANATRAIGSGMADKKAVEFALGHATTVAQKIITRIKDTFGIKSPSKVMLEVGGQISEGLALGIEAGAAAAIAAGTSVAQRAAEAAQAAAEGNTITFGVGDIPTPKVPIRSDFNAGLPRTEVRSDDPGQIIDLRPEEERDLTRKAAIKAGIAAIGMAAVAAAFADNGVPLPQPPKIPKSDEHRGLINSETFKGAEIQEAIQRAINIMANFHPGDDAGGLRSNFNAEGGETWPEKLTRDIGLVTDRFFHGAESTRDDSDIPRIAEFAVGQLDVDLQHIIEEGIKNGTITSSFDARQALQPVFESLREELDDGDLDKFGSAGERIAERILLVASKHFTEASNAPFGPIANPRLTMNAEDNDAMRITEADIIKLATMIAKESKPNVSFDQTFPERTDSRAVASDIAWKLTGLRTGPRPDALVGPR